MKKNYLSLLFFCFLALHVFGVNVTVTMNSTSQTMTLIEKSSGTSVDVGTPTSNVYTFSADPGTYVLNGFNATGISNGTLEVEVTDEATQAFKITTITAYAGNSGWVLGTDYTLDCQASSRDGILRTITVSTTATAGKQTFLMNIGDSYRLSYTMSAAQIANGYLPTFKHSNTVTASAANAFLTIPKGTMYSLTAPENATIYVGAKLGAVVQSSGGTHYVPFSEIASDSSKVAGGKKTNYYTLGQGCVYNFRVSQTGKLTNGGIFTVPTTAGRNLEITQANMDAASPKMIDHDVTHNSYANVGDILMNINKQGNLNLSVGQKRQLLFMRSWQLTDTQVNNYFIEPDFHYKIVDINGNEVSNVIKINEKNEMEAIGNGTAIVLVTYDAIQLKIYNNAGTASNYMVGPLFTSIWPENTGTFVVNVGQPDGNSIVPNMKVQEKNRVDNSDGMGADLDSEHDVMYYMEGEAGYKYTFKPNGVTSVSVANPVLGTNSSNYNGFINVPANEDGTYTALLTYGRNIIKMTSASGASVYQVVSAKPAGYVISNKSRPGKPIFPGDDINIQFHGFFHPANKLSGIYNMSAYILYNSIPNGNSLILSPNQYTFGGNPAAQLTQFHVPADWDASKPYELRNGAIQINGYGSVIGKHRDISVVTGINPNFTAVVRVNYFGSIPNVDVPLSAPVDGFKFTGLPSGAEIIVKNDVNDTINANANGEYLGTYRTYSYVIYADGYKALQGTATIAENDGIKEIPVTMAAITDTKWDGTSMAKPKQVTAEEALVAGSEFENKSGYYKISNGYELRWIAYQTEQKNPSINAILTSDIDLNSKAWTPIGPSNTLKYTGIFEGNYKRVKGLYINSSSGYAALFGFVASGKIKNLTTEGNIAKAYSSMFGALTGEFFVENCHNKADVKGGQGTGGLVGVIFSTSGNPVVKNCSNSGNVNTGSSMYAGGFVGQISGSVTIENCWNSGKVTSTNGYIGGFSGSISTGIVKNCYNTGNISADGTNVGGMIGYAQGGSIVNCYNYGKISNTNAAGYGAIKGAGTTATVTNCYAPDNIGNNIKADGTVIKTPVAFRSGEVSWLLGQAFGQQITVDSIPVISADSVYRVIYTTTFVEHPDTIYTNGSLPVFDIAGYSGIWYTHQGGDIVSQATQSGTLFIQYTDIATPTKPTLLNAIPFETSAELSWKASSDNVRVTGYNIYIDDLLVGTSTDTHFKISGLTAATTYTVKVRAFDAVGNLSEPDFVFVKTIDVTAPTAPTELSYKPFENSVSLTWKASTDNVGVVGYNIYKDNTLMGSSSSTTFTVVGLLEDTEYTIAIVAFDNAGNTSAKTITVVRTADETAPSIPLGLNAVVSANSASLSWLKSTDNVAVTGYRVYLNNSIITTTSDNKYKIEGLSPVSTYNIGVEAVDRVGNVSSRANTVIMTLVTGITDAKSEKITVYPNPFTHYIVVDAPENEDITISDMSGKVIMIVTLTSNHQHVDTSMLPAGAYLLKAGDQIVKIIK